MTYDTVLVGAGLAGLTAALRLVEDGQKVLLLARGVGATHLAGSTIDVLGYAPERVDSPAEALPGFVAAHPEHPYARVSAESLGASLDWLAERTGYRGGLEANLVLPTAVGVPKPTALVPASMVAGDVRAGGRFVFVGLRGLKDFYPALVAENLSRAGIAARAVEIAPPLDGEGDPGSLGFARRFDRPAFRGAVVSELAPLLEPGESVGFPAVLGLRDHASAFAELEQHLERPVFEVPTLPPSVPGMRLYETLTNALRRAGGRVVIGDAVSGAETSGDRVDAVLVETAARRTPVRARAFVLATGGFASGGLELDSRGQVRETVLDLPVSGVPDGRRFEPEYFGDHAFGRVGIAVDDAFRPLDPEGRVVYENVHVAGATLAGALPWREQSGNGISLATGYAAAAQVLEEVGAAA